MLSYGINQPQGCTVMHKVCVFRFVLLGCCKSNLPLSFAYFSAAAKRLPNGTYETVGRPRHYQIPVRLATQEFLLSKSMSDRPRWCSHVGHVVIKICIFVSIFLCQTNQNLCGPHEVPTGWSAGRPRIFVSCSTDIFKWYGKSQFYPYSWGLHLPHP